MSIEGTIETTLADVENFPGAKIAFALLEQALPYVLNAVSTDIAKSGVVQNFVTGLEQLWPIIKSEVADLGEPFQNMIALLTGSGALTPDQLVSMQALNAEADAAFAAAEAAYDAAHPAAP